MPCQFNSHSENQSALIGADIDLIHADPDDSQISPTSSIVIPWSTAPE